MAKRIYRELTDDVKKSISNGINVEDVYLDNLINVIDNLVEKTSNYKQSVEEEYALF